MSSPYSSNYPAPNSAPQSQPPVHPSGPPPYSGPQFSPNGYMAHDPQQPARPKGLAIATMVVGIVSLLFAAVAIFGIIGGLVAIVLGILALVKGQSKGMSIAGLVTGALAVVVAVVILIGSFALFGALADSSDTATDDIEQLVEDLESLEPETTPVADPDGDAEPEAEAEPEDVAAEPEWTTVLEVSGTADQQTETIALTGGQVRITYNFTDNTGYDMIFAAIYMLDEGVDIMVDGGIPDVMISEAGSGETILRKGEGEYYLRINSANASYTVTVEELK